MRPLDSAQRPMLLLGPQPQFASLRWALEKFRLRRPVALVTAGWEEDEAEDEAWRRVLPRGSVNLGLFKRTEHLFAADPEIIQLLQRRQDELRHLRDIYRVRLGFALRASMFVEKSTSELVDFSTERGSALGMVRQLDLEYLARTSEVCVRYDRLLNLDQRPQVLEHRQQLGKILQSCSGLVLAGGHAAIILNRLQIFALLPAAAHLPIVACSAGAMALAQQIVFFHDGIPQGDTNPEVLRAGMGLVQGILPLPDGSQRLDLGQQARVAMFAQRFAPLACVLLDADTWVEREQGVWRGSPKARQLSLHGTTEAFGAA